MDASDEESDAPEIRVAAGVDSRSLATGWSQNVLHADTVCKEQDRPYLLALLVEAALMELPVKTLSVAINEHTTDYAITIKGYKGLMSLRQWYNTFLGKNRNHMLDNVTDVFHQLTDVGSIVIIRLKKVKFQGPASVSGARRMASTPIIDTSTTPATGRRVRKQ
jgi:hypothetical protein